MKPKIKWAGAPPSRKRRTNNKLKSKGGRPRRQPPSEAMLEIEVRPWIPTALTNPLHLAVLRGRVDDFTIAEEADKLLATEFGRDKTRDHRHAFIADWLNMDAGTLKNWLNRSKRAR